MVERENAEAVLDVFPVGEVVAQEVVQDVAGRRVARGRRRGWG